MSRTARSKPPDTYVIGVEYASAELDYADMVALAGMCRRWAIHEDEAAVSGEQRTRLVQYSADFEQIAESVGPRWRASDPSDEPNIWKFVATLERRNSNVTDFAALSRMLRPTRR